MSIALEHVKTPTAMFEITSDGTNPPSALAENAHRIPIETEAGQASGE
jgi:homoserine acetyltransferase